MLNPGIGIIPYLTLDIDEIFRERLILKVFAPNPSVFSYCDERIISSLNIKTKDSLNMDLSYLFIRYSDNKASIIPSIYIAKEIPSQFFRKIISEKMHGHNAFWNRKIPSEFQKNIDILTDRITFAIDCFKKND